METNLEKFKTLTVLIVATASHARAAIRRMVMELGVRNIAESSTTSDAMERINTIRPHIILCDWEVEPLSALEFCRAVRESGDIRDRNVPFIALADQLREEHVFTGRDKGITEILVKPFSLRTLALRVSTSVERPRDFVETDIFIGPDRRRREKNWRGPERRSRR